MMHCFTSFTFSYLGRARVLGRSVKRHHPEWKLTALIADEPPPGFSFNPADEPFDEVVRASDLDIPSFRQWIFHHEIVEACTAVKGLFLEQAFRGGTERVVYLDPDIALFRPLEALQRLLDESDIVLTPHQLAPERTEQAIIDNEIGSLKHGTFNLGFFAVRNRGDGRRFAEWWSERLRVFCRDGISDGLFTDQRWCDLVPSFFESYAVVRDATWNVASWNLSNRPVEIDEKGRILVAGSPLSFFHFTKLGQIGDLMTSRYAGHGTAVFELWSWYKREVAAATDPRIPPSWWAYATFNDGTPIFREARRLYRSRPDLRTAFADPFATGDGSYAAWLASQAATQPSST